MSILRNLIENIAIKGLCFPAKAVYMDMPCEIIAGSIADTISKKRNNKGMVISRKETKKIKKNICLKPKNKYTIDINEIRLGTDRKRYDNYRNLRSGFFAKQGRFSLEKKGIYWG